MGTNDLIYIIHTTHYTLLKGANGSKSEMSSAINKAITILTETIDGYNAANVKEVIEEKFNDEHPDYIRSSQEEI